MEHSGRLRLDRPASVGVVSCVDVHSPIEIIPLAALGLELLIPLVIVRLDPTRLASAYIFL